MFPVTVYGFALAPAVGRTVADQVNGKPAPELNNLSPTRIANFDSVQIEAFITGTSQADNPG